MRQGDEFLAPARSRWPLHHKWSRASLLVFNMLRAHWHLHWASVPESMCEPLTEFFLHYISGLYPRSYEAMAILVACGGDHVNRRLSACASASEEIGTQRAHDVMITLSLRQNDVAFAIIMHHVIASCVRWVHVTTSSDTNVWDKNLGHGLGSV